MSQWDEDGLTERQLFTLLVLARGHAEGLCPSMREVGAALGAVSTNAVNDKFRALEAKGLIDRRDIAARSVALTERGWRVARKHVADLVVHHLAVRIGAFNRTQVDEVEALIASIESRRAERAA